MPPSVPHSFPHLIQVLLAELKRRRVLRTGAVYLAGAWLVIQVTATTQGALGLPERAVTWVVLAAMTGLPVVLVLAWLFAFRVSGEVAVETTPVQLALTPWQVWGTIAGATLLGAGLLAGTGFLSVKLSGGGGNAPAASPALTTVAVLPFEALSDDARDTRLAETYARSLTEALSDVSGLTVIAAQNGSGNMDPRALGEHFGAGTLVRGTLVVSGDSLRAMVELVDPQTGATSATKRVDGRGDDALVLVDAMVPEAARFVREQIGRSVLLRQWQAGTVSDSAWRLLRAANALENRSHEHQGRGAAKAALSDLALADSLLARALVLDPDYAGARLLRARVAYGSTYILLNPMQPDHAGATAAFERGVRHATEAIAREAQNPEGYERRGLLRTLALELMAPGSPAELARLEQQAERDLRTAISFDPARAPSLAALAKLLATRGELVEARSLLREAYEADAYLDRAPEVLGMLFTYAFELGEDAEAAPYCAEMQRRMKMEMQAAYCSLMLDTWSRDRRADPAQAWHAVDRVLGAVPPQLRAAIAPRYQALAAGVLARAGLADSARAVLERARSQAQDPELLQLEAGVRALLGENDVAIALLRRYALEQPSGLGVLASSRRFAGLEENPLKAAAAR